MKITFLIGNGFDLNLGLETKYAQFLKVYRESPSPEGSILKHFKETFLKDELLWTDAELAFGSITADFENEGYTVAEYDECYSDFLKNLLNYLTNQEKRFNSVNLSSATLTSIAKSLSNYKSPFREEERLQLENVEKTIRGGYTYNFLVFNYTRTLEILMNRFGNAPSLGARKFELSTYGNSFGKLLHVHGTTLKDPVFGVDNSNQIKSLSFFNGYGEEYITQLIKPEANKAFLENTDEKAHSLLQESDLIYIYGMSIGETDARWWQRICDLMIKSPNLYVIIHQHDFPTFPLLRHLLSFKKSIRDSFLAYSNLSNADKTALSERLLVTGDNIFKSINNIVK